MQEDDKIINVSIENVYPIRSKRKNTDGVEYVYANYEVFIPYDFIQIMNIRDCLYLYMDDGVVYVTGVKPDGSVPSKRLSVYLQRGSGRSRKFKPVETRNNKWKRFFIVPRKFFPFVGEDRKVKFSLDTTGVERFSGVPAVLTMELI